MTLSYATSTIASSQTLLPVPFPYLSQQDVHVLVNGTQVADALLMWASSSTIEVASIGASVGDAVKVFRATPSGALLVQAQAGPIDHRQINTMGLQMLYVAQEAIDAAGTLGSLVGTDLTAIEAAVTSSNANATSAAEHDAAAAASAVLAVDAASTMGAVPNVVNTWMTGKSAAILQRGVLKFVTPEMMLDPALQIIYMEAANPMDASGATDFKDALDAVTALLRANVGATEWPTGWERQQWAVAFQPGQRYRTTRGFDLTGLQTRGALIAGNGAQLFGDYAGGTALLDMLGSAGLTVSDLSVESDNGKQPVCGTLIGRRTNAEVAENIHLHNYRQDGWFTKAGGYNWGSELFTASGNTAFFNYDQHACAWLIDSTNSLDVASMSRATGVTATVGLDTSCVQHNFFGGAIRNVQGNENGALGIISTATGSLTNVRGIKLSGTYITNTAQGISGTAGPAVRVKGPVSGLELNIHAEAGAADSIINLSHLVYFDMSDTYNPLVMADLKVHEYVGEFEIAMFGRSDNTSNLELDDVDIHASESLGQYPAATYAPMWDPATFLATNTKVNGTIGLVVRGTSEATFDNMNLVDFRGTLNTNAPASQIGLGAGNSRVKVNSSASTGGWDHASILACAANGPFACNNADIVEIIGSVTAMSLTNGSRYRNFDVINTTTGAVTVSGLAGVSQIVGPGQTLHVVQLATVFYGSIKSTDNTSTTPTTGDNTTLIATTAFVNSEIAAKLAANVNASGADSDITYPIGTQVVIGANPTTHRNQYGTAGLDTGDATQFDWNAGTTCTGTWAQRGRVSASSFIMAERVL